MTILTPNRVFCKKVKPVLREKIRNMKKLLWRIFLISQFIFLPLFISVVPADPPGPPSPGGDPISNGGTPVGAPIDNSVFVLFVLGIAYGFYKIYVIRKNKGTQEEKEPV